MVQRQRLAVVFGGDDVMAALRLHGAQVGQCRSLAALVAHAPVDGQRSVVVELSSRTRVLRNTGRESVGKSVAVVRVVGHPRRMLLRAAAQSDLPAMVDVQHAGALRALAHIFPQDEYPFPRAAIHSRWASEIESGVEVYVIENDDGQTVAFAAVRDNELLSSGTAVETGHRAGGGCARQAGGTVPRPPARPLRDCVLSSRTTGRADLDEKLGWRQTDRLSRTLFPPTRCSWSTTRSLSAWRSSRQNNSTSATRTITDVPPVLHRWAESGDASGR